MTMTQRDMTKDTIATARTGGHPVPASHDDETDWEWLSADYSDYARRFIDDDTGDIPTSAPVLGLTAWIESQPEGYQRFHGYIR